MAKQDVKKKQPMQEQRTNQKSDNLNQSKEFSSSDRMRESDISKQSGQNVKPDKREESTKHNK